MKPVQAAFRSKAMACLSPSRSRSSPAAEGTSASGVMVATMTRSMSSGAKLRSHQPSCDQPSAARAAVSARSVPVSPTATWRLEMPVRVTIHSSFVSTSLASLSFSTSSAGRAFPHPMIVQPMTSPRNTSIIKLLKYTTERRSVPDPDEFPT